MVAHGLKRALSACACCLGTFSASVPIPFWCQVIFSLVLSGAFGWVQLLSFPSLLYLCACTSIRMPAVVRSVGIAPLFLTQTGRHPLLPRRLCADVLSETCMHRNFKPIYLTRFPESPPHENSAAGEKQGVCLSCFFSLSFSVCLCDRGTKERGQLLLFKTSRGELKLQNHS